jgi:syntaxin 1B/2/3
MQDRLTEINRNKDVQKNEVAIDIDDDEGAGLMPEFFDEVGQIKTLISLIRLNIKSIQEAYNKQVWGSIDSPKNQKELEQLLEATNTAANQVRTRLNKMKQENSKLPAENQQKKTRTNMHSTLLNKFMTLMREYQSLQANYKERYREKLQRQAEIVKPGITNEEVEQMMHSGTEYFADQMLSDEKHTSAKGALVHIQEQSRELQQLEKSIQELNQLFVDLAAATEVSSGSIDEVTSTLNQSVMETSVAIANVDKANEYAMQRRRRLALLISSVVTVILVIVAIIGGLIAAKVML